MLFKEKVALWDAYEICNYNSMTNAEFCILKHVVHIATTDVYTK
jgi:hypothetical protein